MIAIITARRGSKRSPNKNIMPFNDEDHIVKRAITKALSLFLPEDIILTTDYAKTVVLGYGDAPCVYHARPDSLCTAEAKSVDVVEDVLCYVKKVLDMKPESFVLMQPTSPCLAFDTLARAKARFDKGDIPALVSVNPAYQVNGSFYFCKTDVFLKEKTFFPKGCHFWVCSWEESVDINYFYDFRIAEAVARGDVHGA